MKEYMKRLLISRMRVLCNHGFFGLLLMHMRYAIDEQASTAYTDGERIVFGVEFLENLSDGELDFIMMHEILHVALQHCFRGRKYDAEAFNIACDIVVNSNILLENDMDPAGITLAEYGESMHLAPDGKEGHKYTAEEVYQMLMKKQNGSAKQKMHTDWDDHSNWEEGGNSSAEKDVWAKRLQDAAQACAARGQVPLFAKRVLEELGGCRTDWRTVLNEFIQEEVSDYSFSPPDRRFDGGDFFLPDFNEKDERVEDILFMVDTSGSMSDRMITAAYSEIRGAIDQFDGKLKGWLGFFDAAVVEPEPFADEQELRIIRPVGGGGTDFGVIFDYVRGMSKPPASIVILTDGYAPFPAQSAAMGIPVLWMINNNEITPPWGKLART